MQLVRKSSSFDVALVVSHLVEIDGVEQVLTGPALEDEEEVGGQDQPSVLPDLKELASLEEMPLPEKVGGQLALEGGRIHQQIFIY